MFNDVFCSSDSISSTRNIGRDITIGVLTSGGDAQGMNAALRAVVRMGIHCGSDVYVIKEGYQGLISGGDKIHRTKWFDVSGIIQLGGTVIGSARCMGFKERKGRRQACLNLIKRSITHICVIGGDGSLTGANILREEWSSLVEELHSLNQITVAQKATFKKLHIVGIVGSIDNDFCGTDMTIGADSALHRIVDCIDSIATTAHSHQRTFVLEVMGRNCGYLALCAALACCADWVLIPESPPEEDWESQMCGRLNLARECGSRLNIIIVAEGAIDHKGNPITVQYVKDTCTERLNQDTRVTVLGHIQRGGRPSAFDRILGTRMGCEAVLALLDSSDESEAVVISLKGNQMVRVPMMDAVAETLAVGKALAEKNFAKAIELRGSTFNRNLKMWKELGTRDPRIPLDNVGQKRIGIVIIGAPAGGMNAALRAIVRTCINQSQTPVVIKDGIGGLLTPNNVHEYKWWDVRNFTAHGGTSVGTSRKVPSKFGVRNILNAIAAYKLDGLVVIGGYEACTAARELEEGKCCIPIIVVPATISNNVPGTEFSIGPDTSLNAIIDALDKLKTSAAGTKRRVFIVETMGGFCGYLATIAGIAAGADCVYINEVPQSISDITRNVRSLIEKMKGPIKSGIVIRNENFSKHFTTNFLHNIYAAEGKGVFDVRTITLGHIQQGGAPSPFDRSYGTKCGAIAAQKMIELVNEKAKPEGTSYLVGINRRHMDFKELSDLRSISDSPKRRLKADEQWWINLVSMQRIMAHYHNLDYHTEVLHQPRRFSSQMGHRPITMPLSPQSTMDLQTAFNFDPRLLGDSTDDESD